MPKNRAAVFVLFDCLFLFLTSAAIVYFLYGSSDVPGGADWSTHLSKIRFIVENFPLLPRWYPEAGFGTPFLRFYPPLSYYLAALNTWILELNIFNGLIYRDITSFSSLLKHYVESGGGLILDTGLFEYEDEFIEIPEHFQFWILNILDILCRQNIKYVILSS